MKTTHQFSCKSGWKSAALLLPFCGLMTAQGNPLGGTVTAGRASINSQGPQTTIVQNSGFAQINWQSFNIGLNETTTFIQPSSSSVLFNQISGANPSSILGNLNANGLIVLDNPSGFFVGGKAAISAHGLIMSTAPFAPPDVNGGGPWQFNVPPPTAQIINYGALNIGGGPAFLIANDIENNGSISDPGGKIGLYAGKQVLISTSPDGRGLSAEVTLPQGSVDNTGKLIADGGSIAMRAQVVNQGGLVQANSVREVNGTIELYASDSMNLSASSVISAQGGTQGVSAGGSVSIKSGNSFADQTGSVINISGGVQGGNGGQVEISAPHMSTLNSTINGHATAGYTSGTLSLDPDNIEITDGGEYVPPDTLELNINNFDYLSAINMTANDNITVATWWYLQDSPTPNTSLTMTAGRNITIDDQCGIQAGRNWNINMFAGTELTSAANRQSGMDGIYLNGSGFIQTVNGNINLNAANEVLLATGANADGNGITTTGGGGIKVVTTYGDVNTGGSPEGYLFGQPRAPYYRVSPTLGGISTADGGNVIINAGGNVTSYLPLTSDNTEAGSGAFGAAPGFVSIAAGGNVTGHYVVANGIGIITSENGDIGGTVTSDGFALSLISGSWFVNAPNGNIYLQEVRNPNGTFNNHGNATSYAGYQLFNYSPTASVSLNAGNAVEITGLGVPRDGSAVPLIFPPSLEVTAGAGGFTLDTSVTLFPSPFQNLNITTTGGGNLTGNSQFSGYPGLYPTLNMSDSASKQWTSTTSFSPSDHASTPPEVNNPNPVNISVSGSFETLNLVTTKATQITVGGDMINSSFIGENLHAGDVTSINVTGQIFDQPYYSFANLSQPVIPANPYLPTWDSVFGILVNPSLIASTTVPANLTAAQLNSLAAQMAAFLVSPGSNPNPGFVYNPSTLQLGFGGPMSAATLAALSGPLEAITLDAKGLPEVSGGSFVTHPVSFVPTTAIEQLYQESQIIPAAPLKGFQIGGPGQFNITAGSMNLGSSQGIESWGYGGNYSSLVHNTRSGASVTVKLGGDLDMVTSRIASFDGGNVSVQSTGGTLNLGSQELFGSSGLAFGIYTAGHSDVNVEAQNDINIDGSRIAAYDGGNVTVKSDNGNVNVGSGGNVYVNVPVISTDASGNPQYSQTPVYGSGIVAVSLAHTGYSPGNINVDAQQGSITAQSAGILQLALDGTISGGPTVTLNAGQDVDLGDTGTGLIAINANVTAKGSVKGLFYTKVNLGLTVGQNFQGNVLAGNQATVSAGGKVSGNLIGGQGLSVSGGEITATTLSQNVSANGGSAVNTLGTTATALASSQSAVQTATAQSKQETTQTFASNTDDLDKRKKSSSVLQRVKRVTVLLPGEN